MARHATIGNGALEMLRVQELETERDVLRNMLALSQQETTHETVRAARMWRWAFAIGMCVGSVATFAIAGTIL